MNTKWPKVQLGEVLRQRMPDATVDPTETYNFAGVYSFARGVFRGQARLGSEFSYRRLTRLHKGEFVYPKLMAWEGGFGIVPEECDGCYVSPEFPVFEINTERLIAPFLGFYFRIPEVWVSVSGGSTGTNVRRRRLHPEDFLRREIPLPQVSEQQRVVAHIKELAVQICTARGLRKQATDEADALITSVHNQLAAGRTRRLGAILRLDEDAADVRSMGTYPQVGVRSFGGGLFPKPAVTGAETTYKRFNRLYAGAVVLSQVKGWEGAVAVCPAELSGWFVSPEYRTLRCIASEALPGYITRLVRTEWFWSRLGDATRGVGARRERTRPEHFMNIELPMPDVGQQKFGESLFEEVDAVKRLQTETTPAFDALLAAVLDRAFKEEL